MMPITFDNGVGPTAIFTGNCAPEEADALLEWLRATPDAAADLSTCESMHTALAQLLMAARVKMVRPPADRLLADCLRAAGCGAGDANLAPPAGSERRRLSAQEDAGHDLPVGAG